MPSVPPNVPTMQPSTNPMSFQFQPAEHTSSYVRSNEQVEEEPPVSEAPSRRGKKGKGGTRNKLANFNATEDVNLVKSWLEICCNPITSNAQKKDGMWLNILQRYNLRRERNPGRSIRSLQSRWDVIKAEVAKFASIYADVVRENPSGMVDADKTTHAASNFAAILQHNFAFLHCWEIMKDEPRSQDPITLSSQPAGGSGFGEDTQDLADDNPGQSGQAEKRPMGRDRAKALKKKGNTDAGSSCSSEYASRMQELSLQKIAIMQEDSERKNQRFELLASLDEKRFEEMRSRNDSLLRIEEEKVRLMREKQNQDREDKEKQEDERILAVDLDTCKPQQRLYYQALQEDILEKMAARRRK